ncbi:hypothetical protein BJ742DRAFT_744529 [Cladochytrium replicatum]|nr:hypothetical protein BJ742DRAFT_744529 [Cladochytrium replicatum]
MNLFTAFVVFASLTRALPFENVTTEADLKATRAEGEATRVRSFEFLQGEIHSDNATTEITSLERRAFTTKAYRNWANGKTYGNFNERECDGTRQLYSGDGYRFYSNGQTSSRCLFGPGTQWINDARFQLNYFSITVRMRGADTPGKNSYATLIEKQCADSGGVCDELDIELYHSSSSTPGATPNAFHRGRPGSWYSGPFSLPSDPNKVFYAYTFYRKGNYMSIAVSNTAGKRLGIRECKNCGFTPYNQMGLYVGVWDCGYQYCGPSAGNAGAWMVLRDIYWEQAFK